MFCSSSLLSMLLQQLLPRAVYLHRPCRPTVPAIHRVGTDARLTNSCRCRAGRARHRTSGPHYSSKPCAGLVINTTSTGRNLLTSIVRLATNIVQYTAISGSFQQTCNRLSSRQTIEETNLPHSLGVCPYLCEPGQAKLRHRREPEGLRQNHQAVTTPRACSSALVYPHW